MSIMVTNTSTPVIAPPLDVPIAFSTSPDRDVGFGIVVDGHEILVME
jgi:hypothetical protein